MSRVPFTLLVAFALSAAGRAAPAETTPAAVSDDSARPPARRVITSHSQRFLAIGPRPGELIELLIWAEDTADRLARLVGRPLPADRGAPLQFILDDDPSTVEGQVVIGLPNERGGAGQRVMVFNPDAANPADALDAFCFLLLSRYVQAHQPPTERRARPAYAPAWWTAGMARQLLPGARQLAHREVLNDWAEGRCLPLDRVLRERMPAPGPAPEKAYAALAVGWLRSRRDFVELADALARRWAAGEFSDVEWFAERMADGDPRALEIEWELWIAASRARQGAFAPATAADLRALRERLSLRREDLPADAPPDLAPILAPDDLIRHAGAAWTAAAARRMSGAIARLRFGRTAEFREVIAAYETFFLECVRAANGRAAGWAAWRARHRLRGLLAAARRAHQRLEAHLAAAPPETPEDELDRRALEAIERDADDGNAPNPLPNADELGTQ